MARIAIDRYNRLESKTASRQDAGLVLARSFTLIHIYGRELPGCIYVVSKLRIQ